ncbi:isoaspartyl peptidase/L-asparaginase family protein [Roseateles depolymerans]|uniref:Isoaspartyl peptidase n=1 Tax=Roseateles depolymerans TaxID=76731 RepID=A0A0U3E481_9BURK|nr:isoaspartyl peptidase/L-asparaginase [Roseateles depolymerans]ALV08037.1 Isoaspartyl peptidase [Roseateles depolymerans]REG21742.1 asparaginase [Roseateles depolymerans]
MTLPDSLAAGDRPGAAARAVLAIHGGAGTLRRAAMSPEAEARYREALRVILEDGGRRLEAGENALDVVVEAVRQLEECELFNAGKGAVYTADERHELDASVMDGRDRRAGAVAGVTRLRNPVLAAREVMAHSGHVLMIGRAAEHFAIGQGVEMVSPEWFGTPQRLEQLRHAKASALGQVLDHDGQDAVGRGPIDEKTKFGTVGAVALDLHGHLAAATSTGGMTNKRPGRVGDSPIPGAGCYADDRSVAVSCTGTGEAFIRAVAAHEVAALVRIGGLSLDEACKRVLFEELPKVGGDGGLIAVDRHGAVHLGFNTEGMYRGSVRPGQAPYVGIYGGE